MVAVSGGMLNDLTTHTIHKFAAVCVCVFPVHTWREQFLLLLLRVSPPAWLSAFVISWKQTELQLFWRREEIETEPSHYRWLISRREPAFCQIWQIMKTTSWHARRLITPSLTHTHTKALPVALVWQKALMVLLKAVGASLDCTLSEFSQNI